MYRVASKEVSGEGRGGASWEGRKVSEEGRGGAGWEGRKVSGERRGGASWDGRGEAIGEGREGASWEGREISGEGRENSWEQGRECGHWEGRGHLNQVTSGTEPQVSTLMDEEIEFLTFEDLQADLDCTDTDSVVPIDTGRQSSCESTSQGGMKRKYEAKGLSEYNTKTQVLEKVGQKLNVVDSAPGCAGSGQAFDPMLFLCEQAVVTNKQSSSINCLRT